MFVLEWIHVSHSCGVTQQWPEGTPNLAGGSAKQARDRRFQAILPLRGKILNVERKDDSALYKNAEISDLIIALGLGVKGEEASPLRYGKVKKILLHIL